MILKYRKIFLRALLTIVLCDLCAVQLFDYTVRSNTLRHADGLPKSIAVAFFKDFGSNSGVDDNTFDTLQRALKGHQDKRYAAIICVGGYRGENQPQGSELMMKYLLNNGIEKREIYADSGSFDTETNLKNAADIAKKYGIKHLTFISNPYHLMRILTLANNSEEFQRFHFAISPSRYSSSSWTSGISHWWMIHSEWIAWGTWFILPRSWYRTLIEQYRLGTLQ
jgi:uncharacterized SAM-binding protein YcdF (DUF218 family)